MKRKQLPFYLGLLALVAGQQLAFAGSGKKTKEEVGHETLQQETDRIFPKLVAVRRDLHANPELAGHETRTREVIRKYLTDLGLEVDTSLYGQSIVGILKGGKKGKKIAWRADMDALAQDFPDEVPFASVMKGVQHGCGHDVHMAVGLGIAEVLARHKASVSGTVYFIFQPEEETFAGAKNMVERGLFSRIQPDEIYGLHVTALPVGQIMVKPRELFAWQGRIRVELKKELSKEETKALTGQIRGLLARAEKGGKPWELQRIGDSATGLTSPYSIFKDYLILDERFAIRQENERCTLEAGLYETDPAKLATIAPRVEQMIAAGPYKDKLVSVTYIPGNPVVLNDEQLTGNAIATLTGIYGKDLVLPDYGLVPFFNDDFAYFQQKVPGVYFFLGGSNPAKGMIAMNHAPGFKVDGECIRTGVRSFASLLLEQLKP